MGELDVNLQCQYLHYHNPYLMLGPFKYEPLNDDPHIGMFRDFYSFQHLNSLVGDSKDKLHSTTYQDGKIMRYYTSQRSSKRRHIDEEGYESLLDASKRLSLASRWLIHQRYTASEHYHLINYGIGGQIEVHADFWGQGKYDQHPGGDRTVTILGYASNPIGGHTIFPALGLSIKPAKGDVLFWLTSTNKGDYDTRMFHMGCPVIFGDKWVMTKWLYSDDQMWMHPCSSKFATKDNFPIFSNIQRFRSDFNLELDE